VPRVIDGDEGHFSPERVAAARLDALPPSMPVVLDGYAWKCNVSKGAEG
jgi:hypothetical protein